MAELATRLISLGDRGLPVKGDLVTGTARRASTKDIAANKELLRCILSTTTPGGSILTWPVLTKAIAAAEQVLPKRHQASPLAQAHAIVKLVSRVRRDLSQPLKQMKRTTDSCTERLMRRKKRRRRGMRKKRRRRVRRKKAKHTSVTTRWKTRQKPRQLPRGPDDDHSARDGTRSRRRRQ
jgi:hypothetical protein